MTRNRSPASPWPGGELAPADILESAPIGIFISTPAGRFKYVNREMARMCGFDSPAALIEAVTDIPAQLYADPDERILFTAPLESHGEVNDCRYRLKRCDGSAFWVSTNARAIHDKNGNIDCFQGFAMDIDAHKKALDALLEKEISMHHVIQGSPVAQFVIGKDRKVLHWNRALEILSGIRAEEVIGTTDQWRAFYDHPRPCMADLLVDGDMDGIESWYAGKHKRSRLTRGALEAVDFFPALGEKGKWLHYTAAAIRNARGEIIGAIETVEDVTERREAVQALEASEERYRELVESSNSVILQMDDKGNILYINQFAENFFGFQPDEIMGKNVVGTIVPPQDSEGRDLAAMIQNIARAPEQYTSNINENMTKDGRRVWISWTNRVLAAETGEVRVLCIGQDITDRKQAEDALRESEKRFARIFRSNPAPQVISDIDTGYMIDVNDRWLDMLGYTRNEMMGRTSREVGETGIWADPTERDRIVAKLKQHGRFQNEPVEFITKTGRPIFALWSAEAVELAGRRVMLSMIYDETEQKQSEKERDQLRTQLIHAQKMESVGRLAGGVAHDFNNMLSVIQGYTEMAMGKSPAPGLHQDLEEILNASHRSAAIVRQLLAFARKQTISPRVLDLNDTMENMLKMIRRLIGENIELFWQPAPGLWPVKMDPAQIDQVVANLCVNARDAIAGVGKLTIETENVHIDADALAVYGEFRPGEYVMLAVSDTGDGMDPATLENIFEPFYTTKPTGKGTGLGLPTVYGIARQNNGFVNVHSDPGKGATFRIYLPRHEGESGREDPAHIPGKARGGSENILVVEDETSILRLAETMIGKLGYSVLSAATPGEAMERARENPVDLLITDVVMPEMSGRELAQRLRKCYPSLKTLYMSGYTADVIARQGVLDEGVAFIQKPFSFRELAERIREVIDETG